MKFIALNMCSVQGPKVIDVWDFYFSKATVILTICLRNIQINDINRSLKG